MNDKNPERLRYYNCIQWEYQDKSKQRIVGRPNIIKRYRDIVYFKCSSKTYIVITYCLQENIRFIGHFRLELFVVTA